VLAKCSRLENEQRLFSSVVRISKLDIDLGFFRISFHIEVNLYFGNCEIRECFKGILDRVSVLLCVQVRRINLDRAGIVLASKLVSETKLEKKLWSHCLQIHMSKFECPCHDLFDSRFLGHHLWGIGAMSSRHLRIRHRSGTVGT